MILVQLRVYVNGQQTGYQGAMTASPYCGQLNMEHHFWLSLFTP